MCRLTDRANDEVDTKRREVELNSRDHWKNVFSFTDVLRENCIRWADGTNAGKRKIFSNTDPKRHYFKFHLLKRLEKQKNRRKFPGLPSSYLPLDF